MSDRSQSSGRQDGPGWQDASWNDGQTRDRTQDRGSRDGMPLQAAPRPVEASALNRFLGGSPVSVFLRLLLVSLVVGALLMWLDIHPMDIYHGLQRFARRIWMLGFDSIREIGTYILAGAVVVVPVWFVLRLMNARGR